MSTYNTSPYRLNQTFKVGDQAWAVSDLFTTFITNIADDFLVTGSEANRLHQKPESLVNAGNNKDFKFTLKYASGHKHVDLQDSIGGTPEFLLRLLIEVENNAWLAQWSGR